MVKETLDQKPFIRDAIIDVLTFRGKLSAERLFNFVVPSVYRVLNPVSGGQREWVDPKQYGQALFDLVAESKVDTTLLTYLSGPCIGYQLRK